MKITQMLKREDFKQINKATLQKFYAGQGGSTRLYIYPHLNAIVTNHPSKAVRDYILCEYQIRGNVFKRLAVQLYVQLCLTGYDLLSARQEKVTAKVPDDTLIYPCNKKYRIFDFANRYVDVILKDGFPNHQLMHEITFRQKANLPDFVPALVHASDTGYRECIIDGKPLARISEKHDEICKAAYQLLRDYGKQHDREVTASDYVNYLLQLARARITPKVEKPDMLDEIIHALMLQAEKLDFIPLTFSHGDLQTGNIWVENETGKIYIIDWESWGERSVWYDQAVLFGQLRPGSIKHYLASESMTPERAVVLLEDILFQLDDLNTLPKDFGSRQFSDYVTHIRTFLSSL